MARARKLIETPDGQPNVIAVEGIEQGDRNDIRTYKAPRAKVYPSAESTDLTRVPLLQEPFMGEVGLPGARSGDGYPSNADTMQLEYERTAFNDSQAAHAAKAAEVVESVNAVMREDFERRPRRP